MMRTPDDRWAELAAAALAGELTSSEAAEFDDLRRSDPRRAEEYVALQGISGRLRQGDLTWVAPRGTDDLADRIAASIQRDDLTALSSSPSQAVTAEGARRRRRWLAPLSAAACLVLGLVIGVNSAGLFAPSPPSGPPGTLGAVEQISVVEDEGAADVHAQLVAHTWGTEAYLEATGLTVGATYELVFVGSNGEEFSAGEVLGSDVPIVCRMNAGVMREDTVRMELRGTGDVVVAHAALPGV